MRELDTFQSYFDRLGRPLIGRVRFCKADGTTAAEIIDGSGEVYLSNIMFTNTAGRIAKQVFLKDYDYILYFDKYIGKGTMSEDEDEESWQNVGSAVNTYKTFSIDVDAKGIQTVSTIAELRLTDPDAIAEQGNDKVILLLGYNEAGDKPGVFYMWDDDVDVSLYDGGKYITLNTRNKGAWVMVDSNGGVDVRDFGAFPSDSVDPNTDVRACVGAAMRYANRTGKELVFTGNDPYIYYDASGLSELNRVRCDGSVSGGGAQLFCVTGYESTAYDVKSIYIYSGAEGDRGHFDLYGDVLRMSYDFSGQKDSDGEWCVRFHPAYRIDIDEDLHYAEFSDVDVCLTANLTHGCKFTHCNFYGSGKIGATNYQYTFSKCHVVESILNMDDGLEGDISFTFDDCTSEEIDWTSANNYMTFCLMNGSNDIDLNNNIVSVAVTINNECTIRNGTFSGNLTIDVGDSAKVIADNCTFDNLIVKSKSTLQAKNCSIEFRNSEDYVNLDLSDCEIVASNYSPIFSGKIKNSNVNSEIQIVQGILTNVEFTDNLVLKPRMHFNANHDPDQGNFPSTVEDITIQGCTFAIGKTPYFSDENSCYGLTDAEDLANVSKNRDMTYLKVDNFVLKDCEYAGYEYRVPISYDTEGTEYEMSKTQGEYNITNNRNSLWDTSNGFAIFSNVRKYTSDSKSEPSSGHYIWNEYVYDPVAGKYVHKAYGKGFELSDIMCCFGEDTNTRYANTSKVCVDAYFGANSDEKYSWLSIEWHGVNRTKSDGLIDFAATSMNADDPDATIGCVGAVKIQISGGIGN